MKILFIENRYKTFLYQKITKSLIKDNHQVHWLIQNHEFKVNNGTSHFIKYPQKKQQQLLNVDLLDIIKSDRQVNFFKKKDKSYFTYYYQEIKKIITTIKPKIVFGEATAFHELLTIKICEELNIKYLNPCTSRYPTGRFSFYLYNTLTPYKGSNEMFLDTDAKKIISSIVNRKIKPDYMKIKKIKKSNKIKDKVKLLKAYYKGEKFNTPSPYIKYTLEKKIKNRIKKWNAIAKTNIDKDKFSILYPMQMQPEANIDVWGRTHRDQLKTIKALHKQLKDNDVLYIKLNPKCKYELSKELITFVKTKPNVIALHINTKMQSVFNKFNLVITVTGTVAIECILANKPVITLINTLNNTNKNCIYIENFNEIPKIINQIKLNKFPEINLNEKINFINLLTKTSFSGVVSDPINNINCISDENINKMVNAFNLILNN